MPSLWVESKILDRRGRNLNSWPQVLSQTKKLAIALLLPLLVLTGCSSEITQESPRLESPTAQDENAEINLSFSGIVSGEESCSIYDFGEIVTVRAWVQNDSEQILTEDLNDYLAELGYYSVFYDSNDSEVRGTIGMFEDTITPGDSGTIYIGVQLSESDVFTNKVSRVEVFYGDKLLLTQELVIDLTQTCEELSF